MLYLIFFMFAVLQAFGQESNPAPQFHIPVQDPQLDVKEVVGEINKDSRKPSQKDSESSLSFGLKKIEIDSPEELPSPQAGVSEEPPLPKTDKKRSLSKKRRGIQQDEDQKNMVPLIQETLFDREKVKRDLDIYLEDQADLDLSDEPDKTSLGNDIEIQWQKPTEIE